MSNQVTRQPEANNVRSLLELMKPQMAMALPKHITADRMMRVAMTTIQKTPKLLECDRTSLLSAIMTCCQLGLEPDGILGQAYLIPFGKEVQFIAGYKGLIALARNSGEVTSISAHEVRENDHFEYSFGLNERLEHTPSKENRGEIVYFYAVARFKDGGYHWDVMSVDEVRSIRDRSSGWKTAIKFNKTKEHPWELHFQEMGKKTIIRRIAKYLPISVQKAVAINAAYEDRKHSALNDFGDIVIENVKEDKIEEISSETGEIKTSALEQFENE